MRGAIAALAAFAVLGAVAAAHAQDTELRPEPKPAGSEGPAFQWAVMAGAKFNQGGELFKGSPTPYTVDFFSVAFAPPAPDGIASGTGFFAGAQCKGGGVPFPQVEDCEREPAIYQLAEDERGDQRITRVLDPPDDTDEGGFVAAAAWIDSERALAVGGTGTYPRREPATPVNDLDYVDPAGDARAWLYESGSWRELQDLPDGQDGDEIPDAMRGLTALGCGDPRYALRGNCLAGGMQRLWWWQPAVGQTPEGFGGTPVKDVPNAAGMPDFHFRARAIEFAGNNSIYVATSGCCVAAGTPATGPRILTYDLTRPANSRWRSDQGVAATAQYLQSVAPNRAASEAIGSSGSAVLPDSYYDLAAASVGPPPAVIASPGGPPPPGTSEPGSRIIRLKSEDPKAHLADRGLDSVRLLAADGDVDAVTTFPDWAVGRLKESKLGVAYTTGPDLVQVPDPLACIEGGRVGSCASVESRRLVGMGTYALNAIAYVPNGKVAWAAGDHGALTSLGGGGSVGSQIEPPAPFIRSRGASALAEREPFEPFRPSTPAKPGVVPPLAAQPLERLSEPALVPYGTDDPMPLAREKISAFAMSRDGSEGWAIGDALHHFDGERWVRCDQGTLPPPDEPCASLLEAAMGATLSTIVRVPLEQDRDPTNDDEFAAIAIGTGSDEKMRVLNYRKGGWELDSAASKELQPGFDPLTEVKIVLRAPDEGWLTGHPPSSPGSHLYRYTGGEWPNGHWFSCRSDAGVFDLAKCGRGISSIPVRTGESFELQLAGDTLFVAGTREVINGGSGATYPFVTAKELDSDAPWRMEYDPGCPESRNHPPQSTTAPSTCSGSGDAAEQGAVISLSVVERADGKVAGWLLGRFGPSSVTGLSVEELDATRKVTDFGTLIRRDPGSGEWSPRTVEDAASDFLPTGRGDDAKVMSLTGQDGAERSVIVPGHFGNTGMHPWLTYEAERDRWRVLPTPFVSNLRTGNFAYARQAAAFAADPDGQGGFWIALKQGIINAVNMPDQPLGYQMPTYLYHYTDRAPQPVFTDAPHPIREPISGLSGTADGTVWVSTYSDRLYRYDRITGWEGVRIPGWDPGRAVTIPSIAFAVAVNDSGVGVAVGEEGRIADILPDSVRLDPASGRRCSEAPPPCGIPANLRAAAVAPDGSALAGGENLTLMWRPAGGNFRLVSTPRISVSTQITGITMPTPGRAWMTTDAGEIWAGTLYGEKWSWDKESEASDAADETDWARLNDIAVDAAGRGLAVGARGSMLERSPDDGSWDRLNTGYLDDLYSVALPPTGYGDGTLVGGSVGVVLTRVDGAFHLARRSDIFDPVTNGHGATAAARIVGVAIAGGASDGEAEAWAASQIPVEAWSRRAPEPSALLHYASGEDPLLHPGERGATLPDAPALAPAELTLAAFGHSECQLDGHPRFCPASQGSNMLNEVVTRRIEEEVAARAGEAAGGLAALFTGDINTAPGREEQWERALNVIGRPNTPLDVNATHNTWRDLVADRFAEDGVLLFAALGKADLSGLSECIDPGTCPGTRDVRDAVFTDVGLSNMWRSTFAEMASPWGHGGSIESQVLEFDPVDDDSLTSVEALEEEARTHYAADIVRDGEEIARLVVVDNSLGSLAESTVNQNPVEEQQTWLENALCFRGTATDTGQCTRKPGEEAIVLANYPTYTYATNISPTDTAIDGALFESTLLRYDVDVLIAGRLGWNGLYYTCAPGLHYPAPGQGYPERSPQSLAECAAAAGGADAGQLSDLASTGTGAVSGTPTGALPVVVASGAGGRFGPRGDSDGSASEGFWRGYSVVRLNPENGEVVVEQRPVVDWIGLTTPELSLEPRERVELHGFAREPAAIDVSLRYIDIDSPAVTHRYDLLLADPDEPWIPCEAADEACRSLHERLGGPRSFDSAAASGSGSAQDDNDGGYRSAASAASGGTGECEPYLCLPERIATIDDQTGEVRAGNGKYPDTFAIAMLSMGDRAATQPLVFRKSPSFVVNAVRITPGPPIHTAGAASSPSTAPPPPVPKTSIPQPNLPELPALPGIPPLAAAQPPEPQPPAPPAPPPPTEQPSPLDLTVSPTALTVATPAAVIQPPTPPVNPAPPSGARREARQRQAATQKSGAGSEEESTENPDTIDQTHLVGDPQGYTVTRRERPSPRELSATRRDRVKPEQSLAAIRATEQPSAWVQGLLYTGGLGVGALVLALGFGTLRPTPRRREPRLPAPASAWACRRVR